MRKRLYPITRDLHLYAGLFISPPVLVFAASVIFLVHAWVPGLSPQPSGPVRTVPNLRFDSNLETLSGRALVDAVRGVLDQTGVRGEIGFIRHIPKVHRLVVPVTVPGAETTLDIDLVRRTAAIQERQTGLADAVVTLHKAPGPHLADIRMNWLPIRLWRWLSDATVYLLFSITLSGIYLWAALRSERRIGLAMLAAGALSFFGIIYVFVR